ncbi:MAG: ribosome silencing factor [Deltaproteobacteria bacterium HGW-Deltaproteobacteria-14]|nr:MAG: ribosome silencing factor [Deltaproteobacteria bacterium HGW-Deltaproteobacteria-14]
MIGKKGEDLNEHAASSVKAGATQVVSPLQELDTQALAERIARLAIQAKGLDVKVLRVLELVNYTDWFIVVSGRSDRHVKAIREHIQDALRESGVRPLSVEGTEHNQWVLLDYGNLVVHVFYEPVREFYELERLWQDAPRLEIREDEGPAAA